MFGQAVNPANVMLYYRDIRWQSDKYTVVTRARGRRYRMPVQTGWSLALPPEGDVSIERHDGMPHFAGSFQDSTSMQYGDGDTNEYDWAEHQVDPALFAEALAEARNGTSWRDGPITLYGSSPAVRTGRLSVGTRSIHAPGPATAELGPQRLDLLLLDSYEARSHPAKAREQAICCLPAALTAHSLTRFADARSSCVASLLSGSSASCSDCSMR